MISKIRNFYFKKRKNYCIKQYYKYLYLLKAGCSCYGFVKDIDLYIKNRERYSFLCQKYKKKSLFFSKKLNTKFSL